ncbi:type 1 glutamine amidotransferase domain-containing protein [Galbibacter sp. BG1]|uniref:type 1 glutamine amidotransferase domain-containing protein n=1 Tax=Galbibacter sp. BG1 TaxID=1170699 RepID=UPI0015BF85B0|nr:type 1 glutamine amidotransferase domain-containing protein [Galbibacter sp. BG1]QLE02842.1 type 1 glutamine amidotransferase domain-containing protein [Galbibacter sp. BG1]
MKKILFVLTSHNRMLNHQKKTGVWLGEFTDPYYQFINEGFEVSLSSPLGGRPPIDPLSKLTEYISGTNRRFKSDEKAQESFSKTRFLEEVHAYDYDALFIPGGHGPMWDLANYKKCGSLILEFYEQGKPIGAVCHGPAALLSTCQLEPSFLKNKKVTSFSNLEEKLVLRNKDIPFYLENRLKENDADFSTSFLPFTPHIVKDGLLITGQNPASAGNVAQKMIETLRGR